MDELNIRVRISILRESGATRDGRSATHHVRKARLLFAQEWMGV